MKSVNSLWAVCAFIVGSYVCETEETMSQIVKATKHFLWQTYRLYADGFRNMTIGRTLWLIIFIKLFIIFAVLKIFFFPNYLKEHAGKGHESEYVARQLTE